MYRALRYHTHGSPREILRLEDCDRPSLAAGQLRVRILAAPVNPADLNLLEGTYGVHPVLPATAGLEGCGEIIESTTERFPVGCRVMFLQPVGSWAQEAVLDSGKAFLLPTGIDPLQAAMLKVNPATAWRLLTGFRDLPEGTWIIQNAANSAVGRCVIQLAKHLGLRTINLVRRAELVEDLKADGADEVILEGDDAALESRTGERPLLAFNCVGGESSLRLLKALAPGGIHITYGAMAKRPVSVSARALIFDDIQVRGFWLTRWLGEAAGEDVAGMYGKLASLLRDGIISMPVDSTYRLEDFAGALERIGAPDRSGKIVFVPGSFD